MKKFIAMIEKLSHLGAFLSALFLILIVVLIAVEIVSRAVFNISILIASEYSAYFFIGVVLLGLGYTLKEEGHIRITLVTSLLGRRAQVVLDVLASLVAIALTTFAFYHASIMVYDSWRLGIRVDSISEPPLFLSQMVIPIGLLMLDLQMVVRILRRLS